MPDAGQPNYRLQDLKQRWEQNPSSRLYLQLAEEYRKAGEPTEAVEVLEQGLRSRPNDLSAHVALGKTRLELGDLPEAVAALETVIAKDPAHLVANKLLLEAHLLAEDQDRAQERLDIYRLLNDRDPELEHLSYRLEQLQRESRVSPAVGSEPEELPPESLETTPDLDLEPLRDLLSSHEKATEPEEPEDQDRAEAATESTGVAPEGDGETRGLEASASVGGEQAREEPSMGREETNNHEIFPLGDDPGPMAGFESLWGVLESRAGGTEHAPPSPFEDLEPPSEAEYLEALQQEGIFSEPLGLRAPASAEEVSEVASEAAVEVEPAGPSTAAAEAASPEGLAEGEALFDSATQPEEPIAFEADPEPVVAEAPEPVVESADDDLSATAEPVAVDTSDALSEDAVAATPEAPAVEASAPDGEESEERGRGLAGAAAAAAGAVVAAGATLAAGAGLLKKDEPSTGTEEDAREATALEAELDPDPAVETSDAPEIAEAGAVAMPEPPAFELDEEVAGLSPESSAEPMAEKLEEDELDETLPMGMVAEEEAVGTELSSDEAVADPAAVGAPVSESPALETPAALEAAETEAAEDAVYSEAPVALPVEEPVAVLDEAAPVETDSAPVETEVEAVAEESPVSPWAVAHAEPQESSEATEAVVVDGEEVATVTLGSLYLKQGHLDEAARIFEKVLEQDPQNHAALSGLNLARRPEKTGLSAMDLLADRSLSGTIPAGLTAKKVLVLGNYLKHLKSAVERGHVR